jgi:hypothetical protein
MEKESLKGNIIMKTREYWMPVGLSGIMDYSHIECKEYPCETTSEEYTIVVSVKEANKSKIVYDVIVSDNIPDKALNNDLFMIQALEACGAMEKKLVYYK